MATGFKILRIQKNLRQADVEKVTKIPQPRYSRFERGQAEPTAQEMKALQKVFFGNENKNR